MVVAIVASVGGAVYDDVTGQERHEVEIVGTALEEGDVPGDADIVYMTDVALSVLAGIIAGMAVAMSVAWIGESRYG